jgi:hypothetical protein
MVRDTSSGGGLPTCQIWKAYLERQKSYSPDTICYGRRGRFDIEVKIQGQRPQTMARHTSYGGGLPTCQIWKACLKRQQSYSPATICYGRTDQFNLEVKVQGQRSPTIVRDTSSGAGLPTCQICKACLERQKRYSPDTICYGRTDRLITIGRPTQSGGALINLFYDTT